MSTRKFLFIIGSLSIALIALAWVGLEIWTSGKMGTSRANLVGGPFELIDHNGKTVTDKDFSDQFKLIYFGYTYCPDVCPTELLEMTEALNIIGADADKIKPLFITIDPERDTVEIMKAYQEHFYPTFSNLTGTQEQIDVAAKAYRIYYKKASSGETTEYLMDHTSLIFLMAPNGDFLTHFNFEATPEQIAKGIKGFL